MITLNLVAGAVANPLSVEEVLNTNSNLQLSGNNVLIKTPGVYEIIGEANLTSTGGVSTGLIVYANEEPVSNQSVFLPSASGENMTVPIYTVVKVEATNVVGYVTVNIIPVGSPTVVSGYISIKQIR